MAINCPNCNAANRDEAKFCDQCGASLGLKAEAPAPPAPPAAAATPRINWTGIVLVLAVIVVAGWLLFGPKDNAPAPGVNGTTANPHGTPGTTGGENPHGADPQTGMPDIEGMKATLAENPLDIETLRALYQTYGMIGLGAKVRPQLDAAMAELLEQRENLGEDWTLTGRQIAVAALMGDDVDGAVAALTQLRSAAPGDLDTVLLLAEVHSSIKQPAEAVELYTQYLETTNAEQAGDKYSQARLHRAMMNLDLYDQSLAEDRNEAALDAAIGELQEVVVERAEDFDAWLTLGRAHEANGDTQQAEEAYDKCLDLARSAQEDWEARAAIAELHGEEPPEPPDVGMGGMANPHGGMDGGSPHGGMGG